MGKLNLSDIKQGMQVCDRDGRMLGQVTEIHLDVPEPSVGLGSGYIRVEDSRLRQGTIWDIPTSEILAIGGNTVVAEISPDIIAAHDQQVVPEMPFMNQPEDLSEGQSAQ